MSNRKAAKELRDKKEISAEAADNKAQASKAQTDVQADAISKVEVELENLKLQLADRNEAKEELEVELEEVKKSNAELKALLSEKQEQIDSLKVANEKATKELETLKAKKK